MSERDMLLGKAVDAILRDSKRFKPATELKRARLEHLWRYLEAQITEHAILGRANMEAHVAR